MFYLSANACLSEIVKLTHSLLFYLSHSAHSLLTLCTTRKMVGLWSCGIAKKTWVRILALQGSAVLALGKSMIQLLNHNMGRISTTLQDTRIRDTIYKVLRTGPGAHNHYHHYQSHAVKQKPKIQNQQNNQYSCNKYPKSIFLKDAQVNLVRFWQPCRLLYFWRRIKGKEKIFTWIWGAATMEQPF